MPLSDIEIRREHDAGVVVVEPFDPRNLGPDSYDVRLGRHFYQESRPVGRIVGDILTERGQVFNPLDPASVVAMWDGPHEASPAPTYLGWPERSEVIWHLPGETILVHTEEFVTSPDRRRRVVRRIVLSGGVEDVLVTDVKVGYNSNLLSLAPVPGMLFAECSVVRPTFDDLMVPLVESGDVGDASRPGARVVSFRPHKMASDVLGTVRVGVTNTSSDQKSIDVRLDAVPEDEAPPVRGVRRRLVGLGLSKVGPGKEVEVQVESVEPLTFERVVASSPTSGSFAVIGAWVGKTELLRCPVQAACITEKSGRGDVFQPGIRVPPGERISVVVRNTTDRRTSFGGAIVGLAPEVRP